MSKLSKLAAGSAILAAVAIGGAGMALADGYKSKKVVYERPADWSGVYFGVSSGYAWGDFDNTYTTPGAGRWDVGPDTGIVGAHIGIQHQFGAVVLGIEGGWTSAFRDEFDTTQCPNPLTRCGARFDDVLTIGARVGYAAGHWMPYLTGGYANARFEDEVRTNAAGTLTVIGSERHHGWYIGGGFEYVISPGWTAGLEYRHYELGDEIYDRFTPAGAPVPGDRAIVDVGLDTISARVSWRWGRPDGGMVPLK